MIQGSQEWKDARLGKVTASRVADVVARTKTGWGASRANILGALVAERLTGVAQETYTNTAMKHGTETEPLARKAYEFYRDASVVQVGFVDHPVIKMAGCSPDGLIDSTGLIEIKCPGTSVHIASLLGGEIDGRYMKQVQFQMSTTGREWCDFCSFDPRLIPEMQLHIRRVPRDDKMVADLEREVKLFLEEVDSTVEQLRKMYLSEAKAA